MRIHVLMAMVWCKKKFFYWKIDSFLLLIYYYYYWLLLLLFQKQFVQAYCFWLWKSNSIWVYRYINCSILIRISACGTTIKFDQCKTLIFYVKTEFRSVQRNFFIGKSSLQSRWRASIMLNLWFKSFSLCFLVSFFNLNSMWFSVKKLIVTIFIYIFS
jgi:hypothetical protein